MDIVLSEKEIQLLFLDLINEYGSRQPPQDKAEVREIIYELINKGYSYSFIYFLLWNLGERSILQNRALLFYKKYIEEIERIENKALDYFRIREITIEEMILSFSGFLLFDSSLSAEQKERLEFYDNKYWNEDKNIAAAEYEEIKSLYSALYFKPLLRQTKQEYKEERAALIAQLKSARIFEDYRNIPLHPFIDTLQPQENIDIQEKNKWMYRRKQENI